MNIEGAVIVALDKHRSRVLMIERSENHGFYGLIGGTVEGEESPRDAAVREFLEETGFALEYSKVSHLIRAFDDYGNIIDSFLYHGLVDMPEDEIVGPEGLKVKWIPIHELRNPSLSGFPKYNSLVYEALVDKHVITEN